MPSKSSGPKSPSGWGSTLAFAASFALPSSRSSSPSPAAAAGGARVTHDIDHGSASRGSSARIPPPQRSHSYALASDRQQSSSYRSDGGNPPRWDDAWDSSSDTEDQQPVAGSSSSGRRNGAAVPRSADAEDLERSRSTPPTLQTVHQTTRNGTSTTAPISIVVPTSSDKPQAAASSSVDTSTTTTSSSSHAAATAAAPMARAFSYQELSPPSPSSYGPKADWTVLETKEIQDAEQAFSSLNLPAAAANGHRGRGAGPVASGSNTTTSGPTIYASPTTRAAPKTSYGREALRPEHDEILKDPLYLLRVLEPDLATGDEARRGGATSPGAADLAMPTTKFLLDDAGGQSTLSRRRSIRSERRREKFATVLKGKNRDRYGSVDPSELRKMAWSGIPAELRPIAWQMLLNYLALPAQPRLANLARKRKEYAQLVDQAFARGMSAGDVQIWHQIEIDVPRTRPGVTLWSCETTQRSLERILYVWAIRHPASGYVQGINDLVTPFFEVFLSAYIDCDPELFDSSCLPNNVLAAIEADSFWCLSKLLDGIQDNYISAQPGIHRQVKRMADLIRRIDAPLASHLEEQGVEYMQFAFRWMNCLLMREISVKCTIRMWDTYLAEGTDAFSQFHLYVCSAFLVKWSDKLKGMDFQEIIMFLQCLPTQKWTDHEVELLLSEAFVLKSVWQGAENHFAGLVKTPLGGGMGGR